MNKEWEDLIDRYIRHELSKEEYIRFDELVQSEPEFAREVKLAEQISTSLERLNEEKALEEMLLLSQRRKTAPATVAASPRRFRGLFIGLSAVAAVLLILYIGFRPEYSSKQLFEQYYTALPYEEMPSRSGDVFTHEQTKEIEKAISFYMDRMFKEASELFHKATDHILIKDVPEDIVFYTAISEIETKDTDNALERFKYLSANGKLFIYDAKWYLALVYLEKGDRKEALHLLNELVETENLYQGNAMELIIQLKMKKWF